MINKSDITPSENELPSEYADRLGIFYTQKVTAEHKKEFGQYFTPIPIARLMASYSDLRKDSIRILDPGCGTAILSCVLCEHLLNTKVKTISLVAYETDPEIISLSEKALNYLKKWLEEKGISLQYNIYVDDFILENAEFLISDESPSLFEKPGDELIKYDIIISNPPYFKLSKEDEKTKAARGLVNGQPNIYSIFIGLAARLLRKKGELIFISPRSFTSGNYFKAFRENFFNTVQIDKIHLFVSRKDTFNRDGVLQETVIIKAVKENNDPDRKVLVSSSAGISDILAPSTKFFNSSELIDIDSREKILHLPTTIKEEIILNLVANWEDVLSNFNIKISTGPVVSFRAWEYIQRDYENGLVFLAPLFWLHNVNKMILEWPKQLKDKGQFIRIEAGSKSLLIPNKNYIFLRRFSTKDDKSRLIAAPYFCNYAKSELIGVENKLNYIYRKDGHLDRDEVVGLCALLNSDLFNNYFQIFNGNVNVSATELRGMRFPSLEDVKIIGKKIILSNDYSMTNVDRIVSELFEYEILIK
ncbi:MAG: Eco57I restriction-modification methylase domain-containing protein [Ignavibacteriales bacterium]|nr:Eco57I restriction-modification methylase domain-containing protein [Ignavibacteriales bacterium]MCF8316799.1 Eco57I restriction-modification methylase domain-containing protein [Ignavibacteriales bacterium]MCF8438375.1 Eco57I restriction-modification methylase domain-containing protein [Ignavibacteriales bacterium]